MTMDTALLLLSAACLAGAIFAVRRLTRHAVRKERVAEIAAATAQKHETLMAEAVPTLRAIAKMARDAGCDEDAARISSLANSMQYAVGMAAKLKEVIDNG